MKSACPLTEKKCVYFHNLIDTFYKSIGFVFFATLGDVGSNVRDDGVNSVRPESYTSLSATLCYT
ncbi:hypothetical protein BgiBS90_009286, partial [Biomphalaria glabrata]